MDTAKIFANGRSQAVRLPKDCRFAEKDVYVKKMGDMVILIPKKTAWKAFMESLDRFSPDFMAVRSQPEVQKRAPVGK
ncbi:MAG: antitoxin [Spirochaetaceae bacterium]|nr:MAG: antitoxin [Spirochaetaceae bacterium]